MKLLDLPENMATARLTKVVTALTLTEVLDAEVRRTITGHAKAVRLLAEANERALARAAASDLGEVIAQDEALTRWHAPVAKAVDNVIKALR